MRRPLNGGQPPPRRNNSSFIMLTNSSILITSGTDYFGHTFIPMPLVRFNSKRLVVFFRDEMTHWEMAKIYKDGERQRCFIDGVRDKDRLARALKGNDFFVHAVATKIAPTAELAIWIECNRQSIGKI